MTGIAHIVCTYSTIITAHTPAAMQRNQKIDLSTVRRLSGPVSRLHIPPAEVIGQDTTKNRANAGTHHGAYVPHPEEAPSLRRSGDICDDARTCNVKRLVRMEVSDTAADQDLPSATVLAEPAACTHRRTMSNQYALVGTSASPTQARDRTIIHPINMGLLPQRSDNVPQNMGALG